MTKLTENFSKIIHPDQPIIQRLANQSYYSRLWDDLKTHLNQGTVTCELVSYSSSIVDWYLMHNGKDIVNDKSYVSDIFYKLCNHFRALCNHFRASSKLDMLNEGGTVKYDIFYDNDKNVIILHETVDNYGINDNILFSSRIHLEDNLLPELVVSLHAGQLDIRFYPQSKELKIYETFNNHSLNSDERELLQSAEENLSIVLDDASGLDNLTLKLDTMSYRYYMEAYLTTQIVEVVETHRREIHLLPDFTAP